MLLSKANELIGTSPVSFEDAIASVLKRANKTLRGVRGVEVLSKSVAVSTQGDIEYRARVQLRFAMALPEKLHW